MTMSARDKKILVAIVPLVVVFAYWFLLMAPKREAAATATETLETVQAELADAEAQASTVQAAKASFARDYAAIVALGKAIPASVDMPSLLVQLEQAARGTGIKFDGVTVGERAASAAPSGAPAAPAPGAPTAPSGEAPASAPGEAAATAQGAADTANAASGAPTGSTGTPGQPAPAAGGSAPAAPAGDALESVPLEFQFKGSFFELADFFHRLKRFVYVKGDKVRVRGRLLTIDSVEYEASADSFPALSATVSATVYLSPKAEGAAAGATPTGPAPAAAAAAPATATADSGSSSPTPTATATP